MSDLKPCPFCGEIPKVERIAGSYGYYPPRVGISCCNGISIGAATEEYDWEKRKHFDTTESAIVDITTRWNARAPN